MAKKTDDADNQEMNPTSKEERRASVAVTNLTVRYDVETTDKEAYEQASLYRKAMTRILGKKPKVAVHALNDINFSSYVGESIGVFGRNGSGKSTLLRILGGLETPTEGHIYARTQPVLLGITAALVPEMTGEHNTLLGCLAMGMTLEQAHAAIPGIVELAGLEKAIYHPMRTYSSGMSARLRFAIATAARPEILLIDEALNAGDSAFRKRSQEAMDELRAHAGTVFLVSHNANVMKQMCTRGIWLEQGEIIADGPVKDVAKSYSEWTKLTAKKNKKDADKLIKEMRESYVKQKIVLTSHVI